MIRKITLTIWYRVLLHDMYKAACTAHTYTVYVVQSLICRPLDSPHKIQIPWILMKLQTMISEKVNTTGCFGAAQYAMEGRNRNFPLLSCPPALLKVTPLVAVIELVIWKFISTDRRKQLDGTMYQWISPYGVWWKCSISKL